MNRPGKHASSRHKAIWAALAVIIPMLCLTGVMPAAANDVKTPWEFRFIPYAWLTGIDGDLTARGRTVEVDVDFSDVRDELDFAGMLYLEANNDRWGLFANTVYAKISPDESGPLGRVDVETESRVIDFGFLFRLMGYREEGETLDLVLGGRYWDQQNELDFEIPVVGADRTFDASDDWIDPIIGLHYDAWFSDSFGFSAWGDIGGFDMSDSSSDFTWSAQGVFGWRVGDAFNLWAGYKAIGVDYEDGSGGDRFQLDVTLQGPIVGIGFIF